MGLFGSSPKKDASGSGEPAELAAPRVAISPADVPIDVSFKLERVPPGTGVVVTKEGRLSKDPLEGVLVRRLPMSEEHRGIPYWGVSCRNPGMSVTVTPIDDRKNGPRDVPIGSKMEVVGLSEVSVDGFSFTLPWFGLSLHKDLVNPKPDTQVLVQIGKKIPRLQEAMTEFQAGIDSMRLWALNGGPTDKSRGQSDMSSIAFTRALKSLGLFVNLESTEMDPTYLGAIEAIRKMNKSVQIADETVNITSPMTGDPDRRRPALSKLYTHVDREASTLLALTVALALRDELKTAISPQVRSHPKSGAIKPESDACLFLHLVGVPLSPDFLHRNSARMVALKLLSTPKSEGSTES